MLRTVYSSAATNTAGLKRSLASSVLLNRSWASETAAELRKEAKSRGLSSKGTKAVLIQRIQEHEAKSLQLPPAPSPSTSRQASTAAAPPPAPAPVSAAALAFSSIRIPSAAYPEPEVKTQIPLIWDSHNAKPRQPAAFVPKVVVVAGAETHKGGVHFQTLEPTIDPAPESSLAPPKTASAPAPPTGGIFFDMAQDLGFLSQVPQSKKEPKSVWQFFG